MVTPLKNSTITIVIIAIVVFAMWQLPFFGKISYPFLLLGTWFHEMGHGLTALIVGADFQYLEIYDNGGGVAYTSYPSDAWMPYNTGRALIAIGGLLGPTFSGAFLVMAATRKKWSLWMLRFLIFMMALSMILWVRSAVGIVVLAAFVVFLAVVSFIKNSRLTRITLLFLGIQCTLSTYLQLNYLFIGEFTKDGQLMISDTQTIAVHLFGTYWMWAILIVVVSIYVLVKSFGYYLRHSE